MAQKSIQSLEKAINILFVFNRKKPYLSMDEISSMTGLPRSTCYRFVGTLRKAGMIELDPVMGKYKLGVRILKLESVLRSSLDINRIALPFMEKLAAISGETVQLIVLSGDEAICAEKLEGQGILQVMPNRGELFGLHSGAAGKVIMAYMGEADQDRIIREKGLTRYTESTLIDPEALKKDLKKIRDRGYALSDQELHFGVSALSAPIFDSRKGIRASVSIAGPRERMPAEKIESLVEDVISAGREITKIFGATVEKSGDE